MEVGQEYLKHSYCKNSVRRIFNKYKDERQGKVILQNTGNGG